MSDFDPPAAPTSSLLTRLWQARQALEARLEHELSSVGISLEAFYIVGELLCEPHGLTEAELIARVDLPTPTVRRTLAELTRKGLMCTKADSLKFRLDDNAEIDLGFDALDRVEAQALRDLTLPDRVALDRLLSKLTKALEEPKAPRAP